MQFRVPLLALFLFLPLASEAGAQALKPFKDKLFAYPGILSKEEGLTVVDYDEMRDINGRDEIPERRARGEYISTGVRKMQQDGLLKAKAGNIRHVAVGRREGAKYIAIYLHGQGGSRKQGVDDFTFGGNFNRIKNLMAANSGLYLSPDFTDFGDPKIKLPVARKLTGSVNPAASALSRSAAGRMMACDTGPMALSSAT